jgi:integrase
MGRFKEDFTLYSRAMKDGRQVWYYRTYTEEGRRTPGISTGKTSKTEARKLCNKLLKDGKLIPPKVAERVRMPTLKEWAERERWWQWGECKYLRGQLARSDASKPAVSRRYADDALRDLKSYILPAHGSKILDKITAEDCEELLFQWEAKGLSKKSINNKASVYRIMLGEAERLGKIEHNPWLRVESFKPSSRARGILTMEEARQLLNPGTLKKVWGGNGLTYCANLLASVTACRLGEVLALTRENLFPDHVHVAGSWGRKYGLGATKTKRVDDIPLPRFVYDEVVKWCRWEGFIFSYCKGRKPAEPSRVNDALKSALEKIGITTEERERRNISFHSWRAFANTYMRARGISGEKVRQLTRHASEAMTEHYSAFRLEDFKDVAEAQEALVTGIRSLKG